MKSFRFIHTADIHLDSPLRGLPEHGGQLATRIRGATRDAFEGLIGAAIEERVDFLVVAGDLYDGDWRDYQTGLFLVSQMARLRDRGIPAFLLHGNHDFESPITKRLTLPDNVRSSSVATKIAARIESELKLLRSFNDPQGVYARLPMNLGIH